MGKSINSLNCNSCGEEFGIALEWENKKEALEKIEKKKCPKCKSDDWYFTDEMGQ